MSLKAFHIFFITVSIALCVFAGVLCLRDYFAAGHLYLLCGSAACGLSGLALAAYGRYVLRKLKHVRFL